MRFYLFGPRFFGLRTGISLDARELRRAPKRPDRRCIYVVKGDHAMVKIGVTSSPTVRIAQLKTGSAFPIEYAFIAPVSGDAYAVEREAHALLARNRASGEWFDVSPELAIAAVTGAAARLGLSLTDSSAPPKKSRLWLMAVAVWIGISYLIFRKMP